MNITIGKHEFTEKEAREVYDELDRLFGEKADPYEAIPAPVDTGIVHPQTEVLPIIVTEEAAAEYKQTRQNTWLDRWHEGPAPL